MTYEEIVKELQAQIDARKAEDHNAKMKAAARAELEKIGYHSDNLDNALDVLTPFFADMEDVKDAETKALHLHDVVQSRHGAQKPKNAVFK